MNRKQVFESRVWREMMVPEKFWAEMRGAQLGCQALYASGEKEGRQCTACFPLCATHRKVFLNERGAFTPAFIEYYGKVATEAEKEQPEEAREEIEREEKAYAQQETRLEIRRSQEREAEERRLHARAARAEIRSASLAERRRIREQTTACLLASRREREELHAQQVALLEEEIARLRSASISEESDEIYSLLLTSFQSDSSRHLLREESKEPCQVCLESCTFSFVFPCCQTEISRFRVCTDCLKKMRKRRFVKCPNCRKTCYKVPKPQ
jgi:hypothetical protein